MLHQRACPLMPLSLTGFLPLLPASSSFLLSGVRLFHLSSFIYAHAHTQRSVHASHLPLHSTLCWAGEGGRKEDRHLSLYASACTPRPRTPASSSLSPHPACCCCRISFAPPPLRAWSALLPRAASLNISLRHSASLLHYNAATLIANDDILLCHAALTRHIAAPCHPLIQQTLCLQAHGTARTHALFA